MDVKCGKGVRCEMEMRCEMKMTMWQMDLNKILANEVSDVWSVNR